MDLSINRDARSYYETGKRSPDLQMLILLSEYFDASIDYLITGCPPTHARLNRVRDFLYVLQFSHNYVNI